MRKFYLFQSILVGDGVVVGGSGVAGAGDVAGAAVGVGVNVGFAVHPVGKLHFNHVYAFWQSIGAGHLYGVDLVVP